MTRDVAQVVAAHSRFAQWVRVGGARGDQNGGYYGGYYGGQNGELNGGTLWLYPAGQGTV